MPAPSADAALRTAFQDRTLQAEPTGYAEYARQVRYRLLAGIW
jgi:protein-S-isoprenylcysteine O-methyltransferase Ste14